MAEQV
jgi:hypothetical protein